MVSSNWGGTYVQAWSSPIALSKCNSSESVVSQKLEKGDAPNPNTPSVLWNAMIVPLLPMRVKGKKIIITRLYQILCRSSMVPS